jgi:TrmH RNA methyltransferase
MHVAGLPAVLALFRTAPERIERLAFEEHLKSAVGPLCLELAKRHRTYRIVRTDELTRIAGTAMHGGIVALASPRPVLAFDTAEAASWAAAGEPLLVLDGIGNPHNLGAIARTAAFFGLKRLVLSAHPEQALPSDAAYRVARGGLEHLAVYRSERLADNLRRLRKDYLVLGAALEKGKPPAAYRASSRPPLLVLGNEEEGLPRLTLEQCEAVVTIPGSGIVQSLNVAATAAILIDALLVR